MPTYDLVVDAAQFVAAGLALALVTLWVRRDLGRNMVAMTIVMAVGLLGLVALLRYGNSLVSGLSHKVGQSKCVIR